jgi:hypothetical protein
VATVSTDTIALVVPVASTATSAAVLVAMPLRPAARHTHPDRVEVEAALSPKQTSVESVVVVEFRFITHRKIDHGEHCNCSF